jgi:hypothetical protein
VDVVQAFAADLSQIRMIIWRVTSKSRATCAIVFAARDPSPVLGLLLGVPFSRGSYVRQLVINLGFSDRLRRTKGKGSSSSVLDSESLSWIAGALRHSPRVEGFDALAFQRFLLEQAAPFLEREYAGFALQAREPAAETRLAK